MNDTQKVKILCLDDEERIVNSLKSLFRFKYDVYTATSAKDAIEILKNNTIAVVISDQRMPEMTGTEFLKQVKDISPFTVRLLLTGFSDLDAIISSVNDSEIYRFLTKPWGNNELNDIVAEAVNVSLDMQKNGVSSSSSVTEPEVDEDEEEIFVLFKSIQVEQYFSTSGSDLKLDKIKVLYADTTEEAIKLLEEYPINVMVAGLSSSQADCNLLKLLKKELPTLLTIGLVDFADYEQIIELINEARLYRYVVKPAQPVQLRTFIRSAINEAKKMEAIPVLLKQQTVMTKDEDDQDVVVDGVDTVGFISRLKSLFGRRSK